MRADKIEKGMRVRITAGKYKGRLATIVGTRKQHPPGSGFSSQYFTRFAVELTDGRIVHPQPKFLEAL